MLRVEQQQSPGTSCQASRIVTGSPLDPLFPTGLQRATLIEWLCCGAGCGASTLAFSVARAAGAGGGAILVMDRDREFYPPAAAGLDIDPGQIIVVRAQAEADEIWALDQAARCTGVAAVLWRCGKLDSRHFRRLQLTCEDSGSLVLLLRPHTLRHEPSWAHVRLLVQAVPTTDALDPQPSFSRRLRIELLKCRSAMTKTSMELEIDDETGKISEALPLHRDARRSTQQRRPA